MARTKRMGPSQERLKELFHYDPETGLFTRIVNSGKAKAGRIAGTPVGKGYLQICIDSVDYFSHKLAWLYVYGAWPVDELDHKNRIRSDNRIENLREATGSQNRVNADRPTGVSGFKGVTWDKRKGKWCARFQLHGKNNHIGYFDCRTEAARSRDIAAKNAFGEFAMLNFGG